MPIFSENSNLTFLMMLLAMGACAFTLFRVSRRSVASRNASRGSPLRQPTKTRRELGHHLDAPREFQGWEVEMHELSRRIKGELDSKLALLQHLVAAADAAATRLERATERAERVDAQHSPTASRPASASPAPRDSIPSASGGPHRPAHTDERYGEIYALAEAGLDPASIARQVGSTTGEVQLILGLRKRV